MLYLLRGHDVGYLSDVDTKGLHEAWVLVRSRKLEYAIVESAIARG